MIVKFLGKRQLVEAPKFNDITIEQSCTNDRV